MYDIKEIKEQITIEDVFNILQEFGGEPEVKDNQIISRTICHNVAGEGSRKLYYYSNSNSFYCYTGCAEPSFDIFELVIRVMRIQFHKEYSLSQSILWIANKLNLGCFPAETKDENALEDWTIFDNYARVQEIEVRNNEIILEPYDDNVLVNFNYNVKIGPWLKEEIAQEVLKSARIGFYPGGDQITIPHYDENNRFVGLRGRTLSLLDSEMYGKYRPIKINNVLYNHPLGLNLYNLNHSKDNIKLFGKAIIFESEKSTLKYRSYFGEENDISTACCGFNISSYQIELLIKNGAKEIIVAFDRQFKKIGDDEFLKLKKKIQTLHLKYKNYVHLSFIFDKFMMTDYKDSPIDKGPEIFLKLFKERIIL